MATFALPKMFLGRQAAPAEGSLSRPEGQGMSDKELLKLYDMYKKQSFDNRWTWERTWMRNIHYVCNRQWIAYVKAQNQWVDVKLAKWIPKPVVNMLADGVQALRAMFESVELDVNVRPNGSDAKNVAVAAICDDYSPILHEEHDMDLVMNEADFWFIVCGNVFLHTYLDKDPKYGVIDDPFQACLTCQEIYPESEVVENKNMCPSGCGGSSFGPATHPQTGEPLEPKQVIQGRGKTIALSPFELAFPNTHPRFADVPVVFRMRWRSKEYYEGHPTLAAQVAHVKWAKSPSDTSLQLFRSLPNHSDLGVAPFIGTSDGNSSGGSQGDEEGAPEYEMWVRPCGKYPQGLVVRVIDNGSNKVVLHLEEDEGLPGPIPYVDVEDKAIFPFTHAGWEQRGGRVYATSPIDGAISMQNILNQLWSFMIQIVNRVANPLWMIPKGSEIERFTGAPGLVVKWNPLTVGGNAKPERVDGANIPATIFTLEGLVKGQIEERMGTFDLLKGQKPGGVDAFASMQLLVERSQSRFASAFKARGNMYKDWFKFALEIERAFGPDRRVQNIMSPARQWTHQIFENAQLQGSFDVVVEDGSQTPKTTLGRRAAIEHLNQLGMLDVADPDTRYKVLQEFGQARLAPSLDIHMQAALRKQQAFEEWAQDPAKQQISMQQGQQAMAEYQTQLQSIPAPPPPTPQVDAKGQPMPTDPAAEQQQMQAAIPPPPSLAQFTPLAWKAWWTKGAPIHQQEAIKWMNGDSITQLLVDNPALESVLTAHLADIDMALATLMPPPEAAGGPAGPRKPGGAGGAMSSSNQEAGGVQTEQSQ